VRHRCSPVASTPPTSHASASTASDTPGPPSPSLRAGVPVKVVSERIGHADPAVTMQIYAHALEGDDATAAEITATAIFGA
jgi:integrase